MELTLDIREEKMNFFLELLQQFEFVKVKNEMPYDSVFVDKILRSQEDIKAGRSQKIKTADLWK
jgi:hypothetical protein